MPVDIVRFGVGNRRPDGPPGTTGLTSQVIHAGPDGTIAELAFSRGGRIAPHANPNTTWFIVIEGGGWVQVGDEVVRCQAGEAVLWPPDVDHAAWTEHTRMRAFVVELPGGDPLLIEGAVAEDAARPVERGIGQLRPRRIARGPLPPGPDEGEPT